MARNAAKNKKRDDAFARAEAAQANLERLLSFDADSEIAVTWDAETEQPCVILTLDAAASIDELLEPKR